MSDPHLLHRYVDAQEPIFAEVLAELAAGQKRGHWMWFVFPQLKGLGRSATSQHFGIQSRAEGEAYWRHPVLGSRLSECTALVLRIPNKSARDIFGSPDDVKLRSSMTLFAEVAADPTLFRRALDRYFGGQADPLTLALLDGDA